MKEKSLTVIKGEGCIAHNNREYYTPNVDSSLTCNNITYIKIPLDEAYERCFGEAIIEYDNKQTRNDRKIGSSKNYLDNIIKKDNEAKSSLSYKKKGITKDSYEIIYQIGNRNDTGYGSEDSIISEKALDEFAIRLQEENPNIFIYNLGLCNFLIDYCEKLRPKN